MVVNMVPVNLVVNMVNMVVVAEVIRAVVDNLGTQTLVVAVDSLDTTLVDLVIHMVVDNLDTLVDLVTHMVVVVAWQALVVLDTHMVGVACQALVVMVNLDSNLDSQATLVVAVEDQSLVGVVPEEAGRLLVKSFAMDVVNLAISLLTAQMLQPKW